MIAIFDSGYGGLTVLKPILELLPQYDYLYLGDNARAPYGSHSAETIYDFSEQAVRYLQNRGATLIIFACNTASASALRKIQQNYEKVLGVLVPVAEAAANAGNNIGLVGTKATIDSKAYEEKIHELNPKVKIHSQACPQLAPLIEKGKHHNSEALDILQKYLEPLKSANLDALILGCTHYPLMINHFKQIMGKEVRILNCGKIAAESLRKYLSIHPEIDSQLPKTASRKFLATGQPESMKKFIEKNFDIKLKMPEKISLI
ncbi:glutamate racemase [Candidatus Gracilibacteria bacterium]|nr:glutamate racemase [Candidatus Gracilibacteria bacterium]